MSVLGEKFRKNPLLFLLLVAVALWFTYQLLAVASPALFLRLDASYGRAGGAFGYALLGLGLGAAAGAIAAQRRYRLNKLILVGAGGLALLLVGLAQLGNSEASTYIATEDLQPTATEGEAVAAEPPTEELPAEPGAVATSDTSSLAAEGLQQITVRVAPLRSYWSDSLQAPVAYLHEGDTVRLLRRAHAWALVSNATTVGWMRLAGLGPYEKDPAPEVVARAEEMNEQEVKPAASTTHSVETPTAAVEHPTGHQEHHGRVGQLNATYSLDWQPGGELSGSYFYDNTPTTIYRLTGYVSPEGELHLLEFTRGRQSASCTLTKQAAGYLGTMRNVDGREFEMALD